MNIPLIITIARKQIKNSLKWNNIITNLAGYQRKTYLCEIRFLEIYYSKYFLRSQLQKIEIYQLYTPEISCTSFPLNKMMVI